MTHTIDKTAKLLARDSTLRKLASWTSLVVAVVLVALKFAAWLATGSIALLSSAIDALVDTASSLVTFAGVRYAERPPDQNHRFGHGKGEAIAGFTQTTFLAGAAVVLAFQSVERLAFPEQVTHLDLGLVVILASLIAAAGLVLLQTWVVRETGSTAIAADRAHYLTDVAVNLAVLAAFGVTRLTGWERADPAFALAISGYILWNGYKIAIRVLEQLLDRELPDEERERIRGAVLACPNVLGVHDLRTRHAGERSNEPTPFATRPKLPSGGSSLRRSKSRLIWNPQASMTIGWTTGWLPLKILEFRAVVRWCDGCPYALRSLRRFGNAGVLRTRQP
jgi:ferrous-iron efflux pump FieF